MSRRKSILAVILLVSIGIAGTCWQWNRAASSGKDFVGGFRILIRTDKEAADGARDFLARARISTSDYDLANTGDITTGRLKGYKVWRISWQPQSNATAKISLVVLVFETGWFHYYENAHSHQEAEIWGDSKTIEKRYNHPL